MTDNIRKFPGVEELPGAQEPDPIIVEGLRELLRRAEAGEIASFAYVVQERRPDGTFYTGTCYRIGARGSMFAALGGLSQIMWLMNAELASEMVHDDKPAGMA